MQDTITYWLQHLHTPRCLTLDTSLWLRDRNVCNRALKRRYWRCGEFYPQSLAHMHTEYWCCIFQEYQHSENWTCNCSIFPPGAEGPWRRGAGRVERREREDRRVEGKRCQCRGWRNQRTKRKEVSREGTELEVIQGWHSNNKLWSHKSHEVH